MRKPVVFFLLAFAISWIVWLPLYGPALGVEFRIVIPFNHALGGLGPMIAAIVTTALFEPARLSDLLKRMFRVGNWLILAVVTFAPFLMALLSILLNGIVTGYFEPTGTLFRNSEFGSWSFITFAAYNIIFFGFGEETGWRGLALPELQKKFSALAASLIITLCWAVWHWPLFFYRPGYAGMGAAGIAGWLFSLVTGSILLTWVYNKSGQSILACAIFHATVDLAFTAGYSDKNISNYLGFFITAWGISTISGLKKLKAVHAG